MWSAVILFNIFVVPDYYKYDISYMLLGLGTVGLLSIFLHWKAMHDFLTMDKPDEDDLEAAADDEEPQRPRIDPEKYYISSVYLDPLYHAL